MTSIDRNDRDGEAGAPPSGVREPASSVAMTPTIGVIGSVSRGLRTRGTHWMLVGAAVAAVGAYAFQVVGARALGGVRYAPISALWTIQYLIVSVLLYPVETYVTHRTLLQRDTASASRLWVWIVTGAVVLSGASWALRGQLFHGSGDLALVIGLLTVAYGAFMIVRGRLAGTERFKAYGLVTGWESTTRAVLAVVMASFAATTRAFAWVMPFGAFAAALLWLPLKRRPREPRPIGIAPEPPTQPVRFLMLTTGANGILQLLLAGGPLVLAFLGAPPSEVSILFVTLAAARVPLVFFFSGLFSRLLPTFVRLGGSDQGRGLRRTALWIAVGTSAVAAVGGLTAAMFGGPLLRLLFGPSFEPQGWIAAGVTAGVLLATGSMVLNQVLIAQGSEERSLAAWGLALAAAAVALAIVDDTASARVVIAFVVGEAVALLGLGAAASRPSIRSAASGASSAAGRP
jgi:O-antigen/teichoic acid export membrane protein